MQNETFIVTSAGVVTMRPDRTNPHYGHVGYVPKPVLEKISGGSLVIFWDGEKATALDPKAEHTLSIVRKAEEGITRRGHNGISVNVKDEGAPEGYMSNDDVTTLLILVGGAAALCGFIVGAAAAGPSENTSVYYVLPNGDVSAAA